MSMNISQRLRTCAKHTGLDAVAELLNEAADAHDAVMAEREALRADAERWRFASNPDNDDFAVCEWYSVGREWMPIPDEKEIDASIAKERA